MSKTKVGRNDQELYFACIGHVEEFADSLRFRHEISPQNLAQILNYTRQLRDIERPFHELMRIQADLKSFILTLIHSSNVADQISAFGESLQKKCQSLVEVRFEFIPLECYKLPAIKDTVDTLIDLRTGPEASLILMTLNLFESLELQRKLIDAILEFPQLASNALLTPKEQPEDGICRGCRERDAVISTLERNIEQLKEDIETERRATLRIRTSLCEFELDAQRKERLLRDEMLQKDEEIHNLKVQLNEVDSFKKSHLTLQQQLVEERKRRLVLEDRVHNLEEYIRRFNEEEEYSYSYDYKGSTLSDEK